MNPVKRFAIPLRIISTARADARNSMSAELLGISKEKKLRQAEALQKFADALWTAMAGHRFLFFNRAKRKNAFLMVAAAA